ncbi:hypothetical protein HDU91_002585, partial [Kappamyces sp. JEL0680]
MSSQQSAQSPEPAIAEARRPNNRSITSRLFQFALSGNQSINTPPSHQAVQLEQLETYNRLRETLFPQTSIPGRSANPRAVASPSRLHQLAQSAAANHSTTNLPLPVAVRRNLTNSQPLRSNVATMHPSFRSKPVCQLGCSFCDVEICQRGMKAILLADTS